MFKIDHFVHYILIQILQSNEPPIIIQIFGALTFFELKQEKKTKKSDHSLHLHQQNIQKHTKTIINQSKYCYTCIYWSFYFRGSCLFVGCCSINFHSLSAHGSLKEYSACMIPWNEQRLSSFSWVNEVRKKKWREIEMKGYKVKSIFIFENGEKFHPKWNRILPSSLSEDMGVEISSLQKIITGISLLILDSLFFFTFHLSVIISDSIFYR